MAGYDTSLASEFFVLSMLHRFGADASLTLANKKAVDISVILAAGDVITIDVKGVAKRNDWPGRFTTIAHPERHYFALLCFNNKMRDPSALPDVWIVPATAINAFVKPYNDGKMEVVSYATLQTEGATYKDSWGQLGCVPVSV